MSAANSTTATRRADEIIERLRDANDDKVHELLGHFTMTSNQLLVLAARGEVDLNRLAKGLLAGRGLGRDGEWVGFDRAREIHLS